MFSVFLVAGRSSTSYLRRSQAFSNTPYLPRTCIRQCIRRADQLNSDTNLWVQLLITNLVTTNQYLLWAEEAITLLACSTDLAGSVIIIGIDARLSPRILIQPFLSSIPAFSSALPPLHYGSIVPEYKHLIQLFCKLRGTSRSSGYMAQLPPSAVFGASAPGQPVHVLLLIENSTPMMEHWQDLQRHILPGILGAVRIANPGVNVCDPTCDFCLFVHTPHHAMALHRCKSSGKRRANHNHNAFPKNLNDISTISLILTS